MGTLKKKIIVVDDSEICLQIAKIALEARGHDVITMDSPFGLTNLLHNERPDLILLDVTMPALRGDKVASIILKYADHECPVVFLSDRPASELSALAASSGASGFISKTNDLAALADAVESYLEPAQPNRERPD